MFCAPSVIHADGPWIAIEISRAQNIFDRKYVSSVNVNAAAGKFYEPGSQRSLYVGVSLKVR